MEDYLLIREGVKERNNKQRAGKIYAYIFLTYTLLAGCITPLIQKN